MPLVIIKHDRDSVNSKRLTKIGIALQIIVAEALHVKLPKEGNLTKEDVGVAIEPHGKLDINTAPLQIMVIANFFPARKKNLGERAKIISDRLKETNLVPEQLIGSKKAFVWVFLCPASFRFL